MCGALFTHSADQVFKESRVKGREHRLHLSGEHELAGGPCLKASYGFGLCSNLSSLLALSLAELSLLSTYTWGDFVL